jgi:uncharacterized protein (TIGR03066 family)
MRIVLSVAAALMLAAGATAQGKDKEKKSAEIDATKLVGKWGPLGADKKVMAKAPVQEFTADGKYYLGAGAGQKADLKMEGTYKVDGEKLTITMKGAPGVPGEVIHRTIKKVTDTEVVWVENKQSHTLKKVK